VGVIDTTEKSIADDDCSDISSVGTGGISKFYSSKTQSKPRNGCYERINC